MLVQLDLLPVLQQWGGAADFPTARKLLLNEILRQIQVQQAACAQNLADNPDYSDWLTPQLAILNAQAAQVQAIIATLP